MTIQDDLEWAFSIGLTRFYSSPFGRMLDIQKQRYLNPPAGMDRGSVSEQARETLAPWPYMYVSGTQRSPNPCYEPELVELHRFGMVSSALYKLEKINPIYVSTLMAYHGDRGARWARERGEGRLLAIYPLTRTGSRWVAAMIEKSEAALNTLREDERIATECFQQEKDPQDIRRARLRRIEQEAIELLRNAHRAYKALVAA